MTKTLTCRHVANRTPTESRPRWLSLNWSDGGRDTNRLEEQINRRILPCAFSVTPAITIKIHVQPECAEHDTSQ